MRELKKDNLLSLPNPLLLFCCHFFSGTDVGMFLQVCKQTNDLLMRQNIFNYLVKRDYSDYHSVNKDKEHKTVENYKFQYQILHLFSLLSRFKDISPDYWLHPRRLELNAQLTKILDETPKTSSLQIIKAWIVSYLSLHQIAKITAVDEWAALQNVLISSQLSTVVDRNIDILIDKLLQAKFKLFPEQYKILEEAYQQTKSKSIATLLGCFSPGDSQQARSWLENGNNQALRNLAWSYVRTEEYTTALAIAEQHNMPEITYNVHSIESLKNQEKQIRAYEQMLRIAKNRKTGTQIGAYMDIHLSQIPMEELKVIAPETSLSAYIEKYFMPRHYIDPRLENFNPLSKVHYHLLRKQYGEAEIKLYSILNQDEDSDEKWVTIAHIYLGKIFEYYREFSKAAQHFTQALQLGDKGGMIHLYQLLPTPLSCINEIALLQSLIFSNIHGNELIKTITININIDPKYLDLEQYIPKVDYFVEPNPYKLLEKHCEEKNSELKAMALTVKGIIKTSLEEGAKIVWYSDNESKMKSAEFYFQSALQLNSAAVKRYLSVEENHLIFPRIREKFWKIITELEKSILVSQNPCQLMPGPGEPVVKSAEMKPLPLPSLSH